MRHGPFEIVWIVGLLMGSVIRALYTRRSREERKADLRRIGSEWPMMILAFVGMQALPLVYLFSPWLDFADYRLPSWVGWVGAAVFMGALYWLWRSHADLGRHWSPAVRILDDHQLVTTGVYRLVRHPMYAAHALWAVAQAMLLHNWIAGPAFLVAFAPFCLVRIPREDQAMLDCFGDAYRAYMARTGRLFPRLG